MKDFDFALEAASVKTSFETGYFSKSVIITDFEGIMGFVSDGENGYTIPRMVLGVLI